MLRKREGRSPDGAACGVIRENLRITPQAAPSRLHLIVPTLRRGNANPTAPAVIDAERQGRRSHAEALLVIHKCRQAGKHRHIGMDADIQAMDGNHPTVQVLDSGELPTRSFPSVDSRASVVSHSLPSLDAGFRHPCRKDGPPNTCV